MDFRNLLLFICLLTFAQCNPSASKKIALSEGTKDVIVMLLIGQSNMAGAGNYDALDATVKKRIEKISDRVSLSINGKPPIPLTYSFSKYQKKKRGFGNIFGPELFLGLTLAEKFPNQDFLFVKRSQGGTALYGAWNPEWTAEKAAAVEKKGFKQNLQLYNESLTQLNAQLTNLKKTGKTYKIKGIFWMQGENDAAKEIAARSYEVNLKKLISSYRTELKLPELAFVMGQINSSYGKFSDGPEMVRQAMVNVAKSDRNVGLIKSSMDRTWSDFPKHDDNVHYNHIGQMRLGKAFAKEWITLLDF